MNSQVQQRKRLGDILLELGYVTPQQIEDALKVQSRPGEQRLLGQILISRGHVSLAAIRVALARQAAGQAQAKPRPVKTSGSPSQEEMLKDSTLEALKRTVKCFREFACLECGDGPFCTDKCLTSDRRLRVKTPSWRCPFLEEGPKRIFFCTCPIHLHLVSHAA